MKTSVLLWGALFVTTLAAFAQPPSAERALADARTMALAGKKVIYVHFGASWCGWCRRLDAFLERDDIKPVFEKYFVPVKLVVSEDEKKKALENAGADVVLERLGGPDGPPFSAFLDAQGVLIVNSKRPDAGGGGRNIGHPFEPAEVDWFVNMMKKAAPGISDADLSVIETALRNQKKPAQ